MPRYTEPKSTKSKSKGKFTITGFGSASGGSTDTTSITKPSKMTAPAAARKTTSDNKRVNKLYGTIGGKIR